MSVEGAMGRGQEAARADMSTKHTCPHGGRKSRGRPGYDGFDRCGELGWLCDLCKEDRADARIDRLVEGLALAGDDGGGARRRERDRVETTMK